MSEDPGGCAWGEKTKEWRELKKPPLGGRLSLFVCSRSRSPARPALQKSLNSQDAGGSTAEPSLTHHPAQP